MARGVLMLLLAGCFVVAGARPLQQADADEGRKLQQWQQQWGPRPYTAQWYATGGWIGLQGTQPARPTPPATTATAQSGGRRLAQWQSQWGPRPYTAHWYAQGGWTGLSQANGAVKGAAGSPVAVEATGQLAGSAGGAAGVGGAVSVGSGGK